MKKILFLFLVLPLIASTCMNKYPIYVTNKTTNKVYYKGIFLEKLTDTVTVINSPDVDFFFSYYINGNKKENPKGLTYYDDNFFKNLYLIVFWVDSITKSKYSNQEIMQRRLYSLDIYTAPELINADYTINYPR